MDELGRLEAKGLARAKTRARRRRVALIRRRTFRGSVALFAVVWAVVFAQMASGNDPVLSRSRPARPGTAATAPPEPAEGQSVVEPEPEPESEFEAEPETEPEFEAEPEPEFEPEPEPEPIVTSSS